MKIELEPVGFVKNSRTEPIDDNWGSVVSEIKLDEKFPAEALAGLSEFSHAEILFYFHKAAGEEIDLNNRHPRGNKSWRAVGIFAQRAKARPNHLGVSIVKVIEINDRVLTVKGLDAIDGTPVLDIKPVMKEFLPSEDIIQPQWSVELMKNYWL